MASMAGSRILEIPVKHHARIHGVSKYGLKRTYKVILDLVVIRTLLSSIGSPLRFFAKVASIPLVAGASMIAYAFTTALGDDTNLIMLTAGLLWISFGIASVFWGVIGELVHRTADRKESFLAKLTMEVTH
jgi:hypothetical protein